MRELSLFTATVALWAMLDQGAAAGSLSCRSVNGNVTCAGPDAASCQTVDGRTVCVGGGGDVLQMFGASGPDATGGPDGSDQPLETEETDGEAVLPPPVPQEPRRVVIERRGPWGETFSLRREGRKLRVTTDRLSIDIN